MQFTSTKQVADQRHLVYTEDDRASPDGGLPEWRATSTPRPPFQVSQAVTEAPCPQCLWQLGLSSGGSPALGSPGHRGKCILGWSANQRTPEKAIISRTT